MIKVLLVDDHELVRSGIEALLNAMDEISVLEVCDCGEQALQAISRETPDVVLMDINMPGMGGTEACRRILQTSPDIKLIGLSVYTDATLVKQLLKLGVEGFVSKGSPANEMLNAIMTVMSGQRYLCSDIANILAFESLQDGDSTPFNKLSHRESEIAKLILQGKSIQEMSEALQLNTKTVNTYRYRLYSKLNVKNDVGLTHLAVKFKYSENS